MCTVVQSTLLLLSSICVWHSCLFLDIPLTLFCVWCFFFKSLRASQIQNLFWNPGFLLWPMEAIDVLGNCYHDSVESVCHYLNINIHHKDCCKVSSNCGLEWFADRHDRSRQRSTSLFQKKNSWHVVDLWNGKSSCWPKRMFNRKLQYMLLRQM